MTHQTPPQHFEGKGVAEHLKQARLRTYQITQEMHGPETPSHLSAAADSCKEMGIALLFLAVIFIHLPSLPILKILLLFSAAWVAWKIARRAISAWARLERLHGLIEQERWEIQHHRQQEKDELREMYREKGFSGKLLEDVVDVLMADDNRLLKVMLEEELGLTLESIEHPLKQALFAGLGALAAALLSVAAFATFGFQGLFVIGIALILASTLLVAKWEKNRYLNALLWNGSFTILSLSALYLLGQFLFT